MSLPRVRSASDKKMRRRLAAFAAIVESEAQLDVILNQDKALRQNPWMRDKVRLMILELNPKLKAAPVVTEPTREESKDGG